MARRATALLLGGWVKMLQVKVLRRLGRATPTRARGIEAVEDVEEEENDQEVKEAGLGTGASTGEPRGTGERDVAKVPGKNSAAVGHRIEKGLAKIKTGVHAHCEPEISTAAQGE